jgi:hypothetical protein
MNPVHIIFYCIILLHIIGSAVLCAKSSFYRTFLQLFTFKVSPHHITLHYKMVIIKCLKLLFYGQYCDSSLLVCGTVYELVYPTVMSQCCFVVLLLLYLKIHHLAYWIFGLCPLSSTLKIMTFWKLDMFPGASL